MNQHYDDLGNHVNGVPRIQRFSSDGQGGGVTNFIGNYAAPTNFSVIPQLTAFSTTEVYTAYSVSFYIAAPVAYAPEDFGATVGGLTNGIVMEYTKAGISTPITGANPILNNAELYNIGDATNSIVFLGSTYNLNVTYIFPNPIVLDKKSNAVLRLVLNDNFSATGANLTTFRAMLNCIVGAN